MSTTGRGDSRLPIRQLPIADSSRGRNVLPIGRKVGYRNQSVGVSYNPWSFIRFFEAKNVGYEGVIQGLYMRHFLPKVIKCYFSPQREQ